VEINVQQTFNELCRYYMEFLETNLQKGRTPHRKTNKSSKSNESINRRINNRLYKNMNQKCLKILQKKFDKPFEIKPEKYTATLPEKVIDEIIETVNSNFGLPNLYDTLRKKVRQSKYIHDGNIDVILREIFDVLPDEDKVKNINQEEQEDKDSKNNRKSIADKKINSLQKRLSNLKILDLFQDLSELYKNMEILDKEEIYLYFYEIKYKNNSFPLFYMQLDVTLIDNEYFLIDYNPVLLINKKALQYISQDYNKENKKGWHLQLPERQIYLASYKDGKELQKELQNYLTQIKSFFMFDDMVGIVDTDDIIDTRFVEYVNSNETVKVNNATYFFLFDRSDEAIVNDYEELLKKIKTDSDSEAVDILNKLSMDFLFKNPEKFEGQIREEFDQKEVQDKVNVLSPISLNKEQQQIMDALNRKNCSTIVVQGPPGNGKSHSISAIIFDALLKNKSILMLSDKKEALDVVEEKITQVLDKMNVDADLQNPVLRLGKNENNYHHIFSQSNLDKIWNRYYAYKKMKDKNEKDISDLKEEINKKIVDKIEFEEILHKEMIGFMEKFEAEKMYKWEDIVKMSSLKEMHKLKKFKASFSELSNCKFCLNQIKDILNISYEKLKKTSIDDVLELIEFLREKFEMALSLDEKSTLIFNLDITENNIDLLNNAVKEVRELRKPVIGYLWEKITGSKNMTRLSDELKFTFVNSSDFDLLSQQDEIANEIQLYRRMKEINAKNNTDFEIDVLSVFRNNKQEDFVEILKKLRMLLKNVKNIFAHLKDILNRCNLSEDDITSLHDNRIINCSEEEFSELVKYLEYKVELHNSLDVELDDFIKKRKNLEEKLTAKMMHILDESVMNFRDNFSNVASDLRKIIRKQMKINLKYLNLLIQAFPCFIVNIRDLGDYIPLETDLFDIVIIDEASQVNIAQAFPAIIRGKKVVVLGDKRQFSNVKSGQVKTKVNNAIFNKIKNVFAEEYGKDDDMLETYLNKLESFNVKTSILDFLDGIANFNVMLKKHFRGYKEIIGYSNENFYQNSLQVMKIRAKPIEEVIQFNYIDASDDITLYKSGDTPQRISQSETDFILNELGRLSNIGFQGSVGVITPFREQQKYISQQIYEQNLMSQYRKELNLKVMTFDSCQGEERDVIYYSLVENIGENILNYIFAKDFKDFNIDTMDNIRVQRLNVGFSRAKESIRFVLSKQINEFNGEIGRTLNYYKSQLEEKDEYDLIKQIDDKSQMELKIFNYITQTQFYRINKERIEIQPQFPIGEYIKQIDPTVQIPDYQADFLLTLQKEDGDLDYILIEYDGLEFHFKNNTNEFNYQDNYIEEDIERQKNIELYGYRFMRINKFNLGDNPVETLDYRFAKIFDQCEAITYNKLADTYQKLENKEEKLCKKCGSVKPSQDFFDPSLKTNYGRYCMECKR